MHVLFIGNSYTYYHDMPTLFEKLALDNQKEVTVHSVTAGGRKLTDYMDSTDETTMALEGLDYVVNKLKDRVDVLIMYATWGRKDGSEALFTHNWTPQSMTNLLADAYQAAAKQYHARVSPVGRCFLTIVQTHPEIDLYDPDKSHPSYQGSCLAALTHYYALWGSFPENTDSLTLTAEELIAFKAAVCQ